MGGLVEEFELQTLSSAFNHAFSQPDAEFFCSGALPPEVDEAEEDIVDQGIPYSDII